MTLPVISYGSPGVPVPVRSKLIVSESVTARAVVPPPSAETMYGSDGEPLPSTVTPGPAVTVHLQPGEVQHLAMRGSSVKRGRSRPAHNQRRQ